MQTDLLTSKPATSTVSQSDVFTTSAREGWLAVLHDLQSRRSRPLRVLLPAYIGQSDREGSGIFDPIRTVGAQPVFYSMDENLRPNQKQVEAIVSSESIDVVLAVHFFGFCQFSMTSLKNVCQRNSVLLVEDCAHVSYMLDSPLGSFGEFSVYSLHKFFSVPAGGVLRINSQGLRKRFEGRLPACPQSAKNVVLKVDGLQIAKRRIANYRFLNSALSGIKLIRPLWELPLGIVPHNYPMVVQRGQREALYFYLLEQGIRTTALYYQLVDEIPPDDFPNSFDLSNNILNLPVHQDLSKSDLENLVVHLKAFSG